MLLKSILPFFITLLPFCLQAQNYQGFYPNRVDYFENNNHYIRATRIDSVRSQSGFDAYYTFHTVRGKMGTGLDTIGASWIGKNVRAFPDGRWTFGNFLNDTLVIKTQAIIGERWNFYNDSGAVWYDAEVTAIDTMTLDNMLDSVKEMTLKAMDANGAVSMDALNNTKILLSKNNGFVVLPDIYMFPYHRPNQPRDRREDYFFEQAVGASPLTSALFRRSSFRPLTSLELYDFEPGDIIVRHTNHYNQPSFNPTNTTDELDSVVSKIQNAFSTTYTINRTELKINFTSSTTTLTTLTFTNDTARTTLADIPEEYPNTFDVHFKKNDTTFCRQSPKYNLRSTNGLIGNAWYQGLYYPYYIDFKAGIGVVSSLFRDGDYRGHDMQLRFLRRSGVPCGSYRWPLSVQSTEKRSLSISPNPCRDEVSIQLADQSSGEANLYNVTGRKVLSQTLNNGSVSLDVTTLPDGLYLLVLQTTDGSKYSEKVIVSK